MLMLAVDCFKNDCLFGEHIRTKREAVYQIATGDQTENEKETKGLKIPLGLSIPTPILPEL